MEDASPSPSNASSGGEEPMDGAHIHSSVSMFDPSTSSLTSMLPPTEDQPSQLQPQPMVSQYTYLGELADVSPSPIAPNLQPHQVVELPLLPLEGVVMVPGATIPLSMSLHSMSCIAHSRDLHHNTTQAAWCALPSTPLERCATSSPSVGCIVELVQHTDPNNEDTCYLARGMLRAALGRNMQHPLIPCTVLPQEHPLSMPRDARDGMGHLPAWACRRFDCNSLARDVLDVLQRAAPSMQPPDAEPLQLSYWLLRTLPLECAARQELLEMDSVAQRLHAELDVLCRMSTLYCLLCRHEVGQLSDAISLTESGAAGMYINPHGYVHDMVTLHRVGRLALQGTPEPRDSWFPGYAWTVANCPTCHGHLGWRFTAVQTSTTPLVFWGLRRSRLANSPLFEEQQAGLDQE